MTISLSPGHTLPGFFIEFVSSTHFSIICIIQLFYQIQAHIDHFWSVCENEAHAILFPSSDTKPEDRVSELRDDMEATDLMHAARDMLVNQRFFHLFETVTVP